LLIGLPIFGQTDTLSRSVTVEREFQPVIQSAGKLNTSPELLSIQDPQVDIQYSNYSASDSSYFNAKPMRFPSRPFPKENIKDGVLEGGFGHVNTALNFRYRVPVAGKASKGVKLDLYAHHDAEWGIKTWEKSDLGMNFVKQFSDLDVYFDVCGKNQFYTRYGRYYNGDNSLSIERFQDLKADDKQTIWTAATQIGVRSKKNAEILYKVQTGYLAYILPYSVTEHQVRTLGNVEWNGEEHHVGADIEVYDFFYTEGERLWAPTDTVHQSTPRHAIRLHPFYRYVGDRLRVKAGVNIDLNIGKGQMLSSNEQISFAPSPDVEVEYRIIPEWLAVYGGAEGQFGTGSLEGFINLCPYRYIGLGVKSKHVSAYTPVDAFLGFKIRATDNLLIDVYARYAYMKNQTTYYVDDNLNPSGYIHYFYSDYQRWKVGAELTYHYQDIIHILASGNYYHWTPKYYASEFIDEWDEEIKTKGEQSTMVFDRPQWDARLRIDAHIDSHWSLYSDNIFVGTAQALTATGIQPLKAKIDLSLGAQYNFNKNLGIYLQINNLLNRHHDIYYTYQSQGIHGSAGVSWKF